MVAVATLFSAFTTPMLASCYSCGLWIVGQMTRDLRNLGAQSEIDGVKHATAFIHRVLPDLESFNLATVAVHGLAFTSADVWLPALYATGYITILLLMAVTIFERRDFR